MMFENSRTHKLDDDHYPELSDWFKKKYREKMLVGDADQIDQRSDDDERRDTEENI